MSGTAHSFAMGLHKFKHSWVITLPPRAFPLVKFLLYSLSANTSRYDIDSYGSAGPTSIQKLHSRERHLHKDVEGSDTCGNKHYGHGLESLSTHRSHVTAARLFNYFWIKPVLTGNNLLAWHRICPFTQEYSPKVSSHSDRLADLLPVALP